MINLIKRFIDSMSLEDVNNFAKKKNINLSNEELEFTYEFIKKNSETMLANPSVFDIDRYREKYSPENFSKIKKVFIEYFSKYQRFL